MEVGTVEGVWGVVFHPQTCHARPLCSDVLAEVTLAVLEVAEESCMIRNRKYEGERNLCIPVSTPSIGSLTWRKCSDFSSSSFECLDLV